MAFAIIMKWKFRDRDWLQYLMNILILILNLDYLLWMGVREFFGDFGEMMGWLEPQTFFGITWNRIDAMVPSSSCLSL